jgi:hypothetical protein
MTANSDVSTLAIVRLTYLTLSCAPVPRAEAVTLQVYAAPGSPAAGPKPAATAAAWS